MDKKAIKKHFLSIIITLAIIAVLILSGPVNAIDVEATLDDATLGEGDNVVVRITAELTESGENIPFQNVTLMVGSLGNVTFWAYNGTEISDGLHCSSIVVNTSMDSSAYVTDLLWGYGYSSLSIGYKTNQTFGDNSGYGYQYQNSGDNTWQWDVTCDTGEWGITEDSTYEVDVEVVGDHGGDLGRFYTSSTQDASLTVTATVDDDDDGSGGDSGDTVTTVRADITQTFTGSTTFSVVDSVTNQVGNIEVVVQCEGGTCKVTLKETSGLDDNVAKEIIKRLNPDVLIDQILAVFEQDCEGTGTVKQSKYTFDVEGVSCNGISATTQHDNESVENAVVESCKTDSSGVSTLTVLKNSCSYLIIWKALGTTPVVSSEVNEQPGAGAAEEGTEEAEGPSSAGIVITIIVIVLIILLAYFVFARKKKRAQLAL